MIPAERETYILEHLRGNGVVKIEELAKALSVTPMTIRRDLEKLEKQGLAFRSHGGAVLKNPLQKEQHYEEKKMNNYYKKQQIAKAAAQLVKDGDTILLDIGTTTYELALLLKTKKDLAVVTNDLKIALELYPTELKVMLTGGQIQKETAGALGAVTENFISNISVDIAFIGISSINNNWMLCTPTFEKAALKNKMIACASKSVLLADESKFHKEAFVKICPLDKVDMLITSKGFTKEESSKLKKMAIEVIDVSGY
ncbi:DeoR/GlpR family DNA-binding transcription regulator [Cellulosilyticum sp. I15G10I2]|uniref:DeoR/GlpR family DNA-binding transcription regulator n=1 Tax=Cellulosilyticum sp. I15G10I2 TaxID=1892843 RepID=UPI00085CB6E0|nr:DeoR/GlpR family DNA-binding transcription regulator [Cellulosilyticum sp. I15G10I2]